MKKFAAAFVLLVCSSDALAATPCAEDDIDCVWRALGETGEKVLSLGRELELMQKALDTEKNRSAVLEQANKALRDTLSPVTSAIEAAKPKWWERPWLWLGLGFLVGGAVVAVGVWAAGQLVH